MSGFYEDDDRAEPPPPFSHQYGQVNIDEDSFNTLASVTDDGRVVINLKEKGNRLSALFGPALRNQLQEAEREEVPVYEENGLYPLPPSTSTEHARPPSLNVVIHVVGSRGDVQPFVALGQVLKRTWNHRVRIATHPIFKTFVEENGLEFFSIGGDPAKLMAFKVKHPGLLPGVDALKNGDIREHRKATYQMLEGCWRSCIDAVEDSAVSNKPFVADVIISNPPSFAHIHCAQKLGIPVHIMFTMPWSATEAFPHPLANVQASNVERGLMNFLSYPLVETVIWQGLGDIINKWRHKILNLEPISLVSGSRALAKLKIPHTYCWSPALIPKPKDWARYISVAGFYFLPLASSYTPEPALAEFLAAGPTPIYIGFGSIVVDDPDAMTALIFEAVLRTGQRALVSKGWGGLGATNVPEGIFMLGDVPHDWLFERVSCVVHHGGAGTTAAGIAAGKPTVVVPFFGDQSFWGNMVASAGAGPRPIPGVQLTAYALAAAISSALQTSVLERARQLSDAIREERGTETGANIFHEKLQIESLRCPLAPQHSAIWKVKRTTIRISALAAAVLLDEKLLQPSDLKLCRHREYNLESGAWDPVTGAIAGCLGLVGNLAKGFADLPIEIRRAVRAKQGQQVSSSEAGPSTEVDRVATNQSAESPYSIPELPGSMPELPATPMTSVDSSLSTPKRSQRAQSSASVATRSSDTSALFDGRTSEDMSTVTSATTPPHRTSQELAASRTGERSSFEMTARNSNLGLTGSVLKGASVGASKGLGRIIYHGFASPFDVSLRIAKGFHNAPKLYGDDTVRPPDRVTGLGSGIVAAGKEFGFGLYDGITGLVTQPINGAKKEGAVGFAKGFLKGALGTGFKPAAAAFGILGYPYEGLNKEIQKFGRGNVKEYIRISRLVQGFDDLKHTSVEEHARIVERWREHNESDRARKWNEKGKGKGKDRCWI